MGPRPDAASVMMMICHAQVRPSTEFAAHPEPSASHRSFLNSRQNWVLQLPRRPPPKHVSDLCPRRQVSRFGYSRFCARAFARSRPAESPLHDEQAFGPSRFLNVTVVSFAGAGAIWVLFSFLFPEYFVTWPQGVSFGAQQQKSRIAPARIWESAAKPRLFKVVRARARFHPNHRLRVTRGQPVLVWPRFQARRE